MYGGQRHALQNLQFSWNPFFLHRITTYALWSFEPWGHSQCSMAERKSLNILNQLIHAIIPPYSLWRNALESWWLNPKSAINQYRHGGPMAFIFALVNLTWRICRLISYICGFKIPTLHVDVQHAFLDCLCWLKYPNSLVRLTYFSLLTISGSNRTCMVI